MLQLCRSPSKNYTYRCLLIWSSNKIGEITDYYAGLVCKIHLFLKIREIFLRERHLSLVKPGQYLYKFQGEKFKSPCVSAKFKFQLFVFRIWVLFRISSFLTQQNP